MFRIGVVPFINALPLCRYLDNPVVFATPVELENQMSQGKLDVALLPSLSFLKNPSYHPILEGGVIESEGPVESVLLFYRDSLNGPHEISSINLSSESVTSNALFKVIYKGCWGLDPTRLDLQQTSADGILKIGDGALFFDPKGYKTCDLGQVWNDWTHLPFVYALWVSRHPPTDELVALLKGSREKGQRNIEAIVQGNRDLPQERLRHYLTKSIRYGCTPRSLEGLTLFQDHCHRIGLMDKKRDIPCEGKMSTSWGSVKVGGYGLRPIYSKIEQGHRIDYHEAITLTQHSDILSLARYATDIARKKNGSKAAYLIDRNINYTNICTARCNFCAFYRPYRHKEGYELSYAEIDQKILETLALGGKRILLQGGFHPNHSVESYVELIDHIKKNHPIHIHAFSPAELHFVSEKGGISYDETVSRLKEVGLGSVPGGGAEILVDEVRNKIMTGKCSAQQWLDVSYAIHRCGLRSTATMMLGHIESWEDRITHLDRIRSLQDQTGGFLSFIPWTFQPDHTAMNPLAKRNKDVKLAGTYEYLKFLALSRIYLDNFDHIQVSLLTQGLKTAQIGLHFGADDLGSLLIEENVVRSAGCKQEIGLEKDKMAQIIREAGLEPYERDTFYNIVS